MSERSLDQPRLRTVAPLCCRSSHGRPGGSASPAPASSVRHVRPGALGYQVTEMNEATSRRATARGFGWGALGGVALVALMYLANLVLGLRPLPQLLSGPLLSVMPGFVFGFLIDTLQHAGKVVEELGLIVAMVFGLGALGAAWGWASRRWRSRHSALAFAAAGWVVVTAILLPLLGDGFLGLTDGPATPLIWGA